MQFRKWEWSKHQSHNAASTLLLQPSTALAALSTEIEQTEKVTSTSIPMNVHGQHVPAAGEQDS